MLLRTYTACAFHTYLPLDTFISLRGMFFTDIHDLSVWRFVMLSVFDRGEEDISECSRETVGVLGSNRSDWGHGFKPLASRLQASPTGERGWRGDAEKGHTDATLGHTGESDAGKKEFCIWISGDRDTQSRHVAQFYVTRDLGWKIPRRGAVLLFDTWVRCSPLLCGTARQFEWLS